MNENKEMMEISEQRIRKTNLSKNFKIIMNYPENKDAHHDHKSQTISQTLL